MELPPRRFIMTETATPALGPIVADPEVWVSDPKMGCLPHSSAPPPAGGWRFSSFKKLREDRGRRYRGVVGR
eukprot:6110655-Lingulodinium_polyedra.AAC.1